MHEGPPLLGCVLFPQIVPYFQGYLPQIEGHVATLYS